MPFILPKMHDRYFYTAALLAVGYAFYQPKFRIVPFALQASSVISYLYFLRGEEIIPIEIAVALNTCLMVAGIIYFFREFASEGALRMEASSIFKV